MSPAKRSPESALIVGGMPRADLLPPEIKASERARAQRRGLIAIVIGIVVIVAAGYVGASFLAQSSEDALNDANTQTATILASQSKYAEVKQAKASIASATTARLIATGTEIDWKTEIAAIVATLPSGSQLTAFTSTSSTSSTPVVAPSSPLEGARVVEVKLTVTSANIPDSAKWIRDLSTLKGYVDATPTTIATSTDSNDITTTLVLHLNSDVYWKRFVGTGK